MLPGGGMNNRPKGRTQEWEFRAQPGRPVL